MTKEEQQLQQQQGTQDPMELEENHFDKDESTAEDNFRDTYATPGMSRTGGVTETPPEDAVDPLLDADGKVIEEDDDEPFKFDDAIAQSEKEELEELNNKLDTDYKSLKELKSAYKSADAIDENKSIDEDKTYIKYFESVLDPKQYDDRRIVFEDKKMIAQDAGKDISDPSIIEEINAEVETLEGNGVLNYAAGTIRQTVRTALEQRKEKVLNFETKENASQLQTAAERKESIQESINEIYKGGSFLGITPTKEDMLDIYKDVSSNKHIEHLKSNPKDAVEYALFKRYRSVMEKNLNKPNFNAGVKKTLASIGLTASEQTGKRPNDQDGTAEEKSYFDKFLQ